MILANRRKGLREILRQILEVAKDGCFGSKRTLAHNLTVSSRGSRHCLRFQGGEAR